MASLVQSGNYGAIHTADKKYYMSLSSSQSHTH